MRLRSVCKILNYELKSAFLTGPYGNLVLSIMAEETIFSYNVELQYLRLRTETFNTERLLISSLMHRKNTNAIGKAEGKRTHFRNQSIDGKILKIYFKAVE
jgi:hypothetical protein